MLDYVPADPPAYYQCFFQAADMYSLPPVLLPAIAKVEGGTVGKSNGNKNGSRDHGKMQINDVWVSKLNKSFGITAEMIRDDPCLAIRSAGYILRYHINRAGGDFWQGVGRYHSATPSRHAAYIQKVFVAAKTLEPTYQALASRLAMN